LWVGAYLGEEPDESAKTAYRVHGKGRYTSDQLKAAEDYYPFYQGSSEKWPIHPGDVIIDFEFERRSGIPEFGGMWRIKEDPFVPAPNKRLPKSRIVLCDLIEDYRGMRLPKRETLLIAKAVSAHLNTHGQWGGDRIPSNYEFLLWMPLVQFWKEHRDILTKPRASHDG
jgi:hypothetical protein